jgi:hypothetical protein
MAKPGLSDSMRPNDWLELMTDDTPVLRARFFGATPRQDQMYWRGPTMWRFDGEEWTQPAWTGGPRAPGVQASPQQWDYELEVEPTDRRLLVALDLPLAAPGGSALIGDYSLRTERPLSSLTRWRMQSAAPLRYESQLETRAAAGRTGTPSRFQPAHARPRPQWRLGRRPR